MRKVYLDNNATTAVHPEVLESMLPFFREHFGNPSSSHRSGVEVKKAVNLAREQVAALVDCSPSEVAFTSGGSESLNTAIKGVVHARRHLGSHCIGTMVEHPAVFNTLRYLEKEGFRTTFLNVDRDGVVSMEELKSAVNDDTIVLSVMYANNETGVIMPVKEIGEIACEKGISFICDTVQAVGKIPLSFRKLPVHAMTLSGHKLHAPKGTGALIVKSGVRILPLIHGGPQEKNRRAGTENVAGIIGLGKACELARDQLENKITRLRSLRDFLEQALVEAISDVKINGHPERRLPNTLSISFKGVNGETLLAELDKVGIEVSAGSACSAASREVSRVLTAMGIDGTTARSTLRFSLGDENTGDDMDYVISLLPPLVERLRSIFGFNG